MMQHPDHTVRQPGPAVPNCWQPADRRANGASPTPTARRIAGLPDRRVGAIGACLVGAAGAALPAPAALTLSVEAAGSSNLIVSAGSALEIDVVLTSDAGDQHNSSLFRVLFSAPGLEYLDYTWASPYENRTPFDFSRPRYSELPAIIDENTFVGPAGLPDVELSNVVPNGALFGEGVLVTLMLRVPEVWTGPSQINVLPFADTFANGFDEIATAAGTALTLTITGAPIPAPATPAILIAGATAVTSRRRRFSAR